MNSLIVNFFNTRSRFPSQRDQEGREARDRAFLALAFLGLI
jgi:hypothetical protein